MHGLADVSVSAMAPRFDVVSRSIQYCRERSGYDPITNGTKTLLSVPFSRAKLGFTPFSFLNHSVKVVTPPAQQQTTEVKSFSSALPNVTLSSNVTNITKKRRVGLIPRVRAWQQRCLARAPEKLTCPIQNVTLTAPSQCVPTPADRDCYGLLINRAEFGLLALALLIVYQTTRWVYRAIVVPVSESIAKEARSNISAICNVLAAAYFVFRSIVAFIRFLRRQLFVLFLLHCACRLILRFPQSPIIRFSDSALTFVRHILQLYSIAYSLYERIALYFLPHSLVPVLFALSAIVILFVLPAIQSSLSQAINLRSATGYQRVERRSAQHGGKTTPVVIYRASPTEKWKELRTDKQLDVGSDGFVSEAVITEAKKVLIPPGIKGPGGILSIVIPELLNGKVVEETHSHCWAYTVLDGPDAGDYIITARHCVHSQDFPGHPKVPCSLDLARVTIKNRVIERKSQQTKWNTSVLDLTAWTQLQWRSPVFVGNCFDIIAFKAPSFRTIKGKQVSYKPFTDLGVPALTRKDICCQRGATAAIYTHEVQEGVSHMTMSEGILGDFPAFERQHGMLLHSINTVGGHSGAPLWLTRKNGKRQVCAMHIGQSIGPDGNIWNFALSMPTILRFFQLKGVKCKDSFTLYRERMNAMPDLTFNTESRAQEVKGVTYRWVRVGNEWVQYEDDGRSQEDFSEPDEDRYNREFDGVREDADGLDAPIPGSGTAGDAEIAHDAMKRLQSAQAEINERTSGSASTGPNDALGRRATRTERGPILLPRIGSTARKSWHQLNEDEEAGIDDDDPWKMPRFRPENGCVDYGQLFKKEIDRNPHEEAYTKTLTPDGYLPILPGIDNAFSNAYYAKFWDRGTGESSKALIRPLNEIRALPICNPEGRMPIGQIIEGAWEADSLDFLTLIQQYTPEELLESAEAIHHNQYRAASFASWGLVQETFSGIDGVAIYQHVGDCNPLHSASEPRVEIDDPFLDAAQAQGVELRDSTGKSIFVRPAINPEVVTTTLKNQAAKLKRTDWNAADGHVPPNITDGYPKHDAKAFGQLKDTISNIINSMDPDKSAGFSAHYKSGPKEVWIGPDQTALLSIAIYRILLILCLGPVAIGNMSPEEHVFYGTSDCVTMFGKDELNKRKKVDSGLLRLIWPAAIIKNFVTAIMTQMFNKQCISAYQDGECTKLFTGVGHSDEGLKHMSEVIKKILTDPADGGRVGGSNKDCEAYDLTVTRDSQMMCCSVILANTNPIDPKGKCPVKLDYLCQGDQFDPAVLDQKGLTQTYCSMMHSISLLDGAHCCVIRGKIWATSVAGTTASGGVNTTTFNSIAQTSGHEICGIPQNASGGDDNIARKYKEWNEALYHKLGFKIKPGSYTEFGPYGPIDFNGLIGTADPETDVWTWKYNNIAKLYSNARLRIPDQESVLDPKVQSAILAYQFCLRHVDGAGNWDSFVKTFKSVGIDLYLLPSTIYADKSAAEPFISAQTELGVYRTIIEIEAENFVPPVFAESRRQPATPVSDDATASLELIALRSELAALRAELGASKVSAPVVVTPSPELVEMRIQLSAMSALVGSLVAASAAPLVIPESRPSPVPPPSASAAAVFVSQSRKSVATFGQPQHVPRADSPARVGRSQGNRQRATKLAKQNEATASGVYRPAPGLEAVQKMLSANCACLSPSLERTRLNSIAETRPTARPGSGSRGRSA